MLFGITLGGVKKVINYIFMVFVVVALVVIYRAVSTPKGEIVEPAAVEVSEPVELTPSPAVSMLSATEAAKVKSHKASTLNTAVEGK